MDFLSPFDAVGRGSHVVSTAVGNAGVPVVVNGYYYGEASGMAPRARYALSIAYIAAVSRFQNSHISGLLYIKLCILQWEL